MARAKVGMKVTPFNRKDFMTKYRYLFKEGMITGVTQDQRLLVKLVYRFYISRKKKPIKIRNETVTISPEDLQVLSEA